MNQPIAKHRKEAREIRLPFPCGCLDAHTGGGITVEEYTCKTHRAIASALSSRDSEIREVLEGLSDDGCYDACFLRWMKRHEDSDGFEHSAACLAARALYDKLQPALSTASDTVPEPDLKQ